MQTKAHRPCAIVILENSMRMLLQSPVLLRPQENLSDCQGARWRSSKLFSSQTGRTWDWVIRYYFLVGTPETVATARAGLQGGTRQVRCNTPRAWKAVADAPRLYTERCACVLGPLRVDWFSCIRTLHSEVLHIHGWFPRITDYRGKKTKTSLLWLDPDTTEIWTISI